MQFKPKKMACDILSIKLCKRGRKMILFYPIGSLNLVAMKRKRSEFAPSKQGTIFIKECSESHAQKEANTKFIIIKTLVAAIIFS